MGQLIGRPLSGDDWRLASLGIAAGGLGARCAAEHAPAAYVASFSACRGLCGQLWPAFDPFDLDEGCHLAAAEDALRSVIPSGAKVYAESDSPSQKSLSGMIKAQSVSSIFGDPTLPRDRRLHLEACRVPGLGLGSPLTRRAWTLTFLLPSSGWPSSAVFVCHYGITTRHVACVVKCWTGGVITPSPVAVAATGSRAITRFAMWSALRSQSSRPSRLSWRSQASSSPRDHPIPEVPTPTSTPPLYPPSRLPLVAALPMSGSPEASPASLKHGISRSHRCSAPLTSPRPPPLWLMSSMRLRLESAPSRTQRRWLPNAEPLSARRGWVVPSLSGGRGLDRLRVPHHLRPGHRPE